MTLRHDPHAREIDALAAMVPSFAGRRVLEIGCGDGRLTARYAAGARSVMAIDPDGQAVARCRDAVRGLPVEVAAIDFAAFNPPLGAFDVVIFSWSL